MPDAPTPPAAERRPHRLEAHGEVRHDDWYWLADRDDPAVIAHLEAENAYTDTVLAPTATLQERLFDEIKGRVVETDVSSPSPLGGWWYWTRTDEGSQYRSYWRRADPDHLLDASTVLADATAALDQTATGQAGALPGAGQLVLDENTLAEGHEFFSLGVWDLSPDQTVLAYASDTDGSERYRLRFRDLGRGHDLDDVVEEVSYGSAWARDGRTFFYVRLDEAMRPFQVWRHSLGDDPAADSLVYQEDDERFFLSVELTRSERFVVIHLESKMTSEVRWIDAARPGAEPAVVLARRHGVEYDVEHAVLPGAGDVWLVRTNDGGATDFALGTLPVGGQHHDFQVVVPHRPGTKLDSVDAFSGHVVLGERAGGLEHLRIVPVDALTSSWAEGHVIEQPDQVYSLSGGANGDWETTTYRYGYTSLVTPMSSIDYDVASRRLRVVKVQPVRGYRSEDYRTERIWATAGDGTAIPISLVCPKDQPLDGSAPCLLYGYGSYEITMDPAFSPARVNLLERGFTFAIAHVRGGGEMGRSWYEQGRLGHKSNTFTDFIACAEHLVATGWTATDRLVARGGSAGGLLMGAVSNLRPDLWRAVVAEVPFVDVVTTMSDTSLPLTVTEWEEWGNPLDDPAAYRTMKGYSPYDNVSTGAYPAFYVTAGLNDPRVGFWEPAKWVAKLRSARTDEGLTLLRTEMGAGHQGVSGRYEVWRDEARVQAFVLTSVGIDE